MPNTLDDLMRRVPEDQRELAELVRRIGQAGAFGLASSFADVSFLVTVQEIKDSGAYTRLGLTWEEFCRRLPGARRSRSSIDEQLRILDDLGADFVRLAGDLGLQRRTLRGLRKVEPDALPRLLESGEVEFPDGRRVPNSPEYREEMREAMEDLAAKLTELQDHVGDGMKQMKDLAGELTKAKAELLDARKRGEAAQLDPISEQWTHAFREVRLLADMVLTGRPDPALVLNWSRQLMIDMNALLAYANGPAGDDFDPDELESAGGEGGVQSR
ncbi:MAG TPA: hypothetical protein VGC13_22400 [Longimicrobium sp.]|uniref:hypothetical protein n=1 Tax=Longimicrobium sp. TaxID=2029185 RepID=UPI002EDA2CEB